MLEIRGIAPDHAFSLLQKLGQVLVLEAEHHIQLLGLEGFNHVLVLFDNIGKGILFIEGEETDAVMVAALCFDDRPDPLQSDGREDGGMESIILFQEGDEVIVLHRLNLALDCLFHCTKMLAPSLVDELFHGAFFQALA